MLIASLVLHEVKEVGATTQKEINSECRTLAYTGTILTILGLVMVTVLHYRKYLCKGQRFSNALKIMFISDIQNYMGYIRHRLERSHSDLMKTKLICQRVVIIKLQYKIKIR